MRRICLSCRNFGAVTVTAVVTLAVSALRARPRLEKNKVAIAVRERPRFTTCL